MFQHFAHRSCANLRKPDGAGASLSERDCREAKQICAKHHGEESEAGIWLMSKGCCESFASFYTRLVNLRKNTSNSTAKESERFWFCSSQAPEPGSQRFFPTVSWTFATVATKRMPKLPLRCLQSSRSLLDADRPDEIRLVINGCWYFEPLAPPDKKTGFAVLQLHQHGTPACYKISVDAKAERDTGEG